MVVSERIKIHLNNIDPNLRCSAFFNYPYSYSCKGNRDREECFAGAADCTGSNLYCCPPDGPTPTPVVKATLTPDPSQPVSPPYVTPTLPPCSCPQAAPLKRAGNANCDGKIDGLDFEIFREEIFNLRATGSADFDCDHKIDKNDYLIWKLGRLTED